MQTSYSIIIPLNFCYVVQIKIHWTKTHLLQVVEIVTIVMLQSKNRQCKTNFQFSYKAAKMHALTNIY